MKSLPLILLALLTQTVFATVLPAPVDVSAGGTLTLPSFGTIQTFNLGTIGLAATAANQVLQLTQETSTATNTGTISTQQTSGAQKTQVVDAAGTVQGPMTTVSGVNFAPVVRPQTYTTGTLTAACSTGSSCATGSTVTLTVPEGQTNWDIYLNGTFSSTSTVVFEGSLDGTNFFNLNGRISGNGVTNPATTLLSSSVSGGANPTQNYPLTGGNPSNFRGNLAGAKYLRVRCSAYTSSDAIGVQISTSTGISAVFLNASTPAVADVLATGTLSALNSTLVVPTNGLATCGIALSGTYSGTISFLGSVDNGSTYPFAADTIAIPNGLPVTTTTGVGNFKTPVGGFTEFELKMTSYTSGSATVTMDCGAGATVDRAFSTNAAGFLNTSYTNDGSGNAINSVSNALNVNTQTNHTGTPTETSVSCGTGSTTLLAAGAATSFISIREPTTATATVWISINGSAAVAAPPSIDLAPGSEADYTASENSFLPTAQINCISGGASASTVSLVYK